MGMKLENVAYAHDAVGERKVEHIIRHINMTIEQGSLICIHGDVSACNIRPAPSTHMPVGRRGIKGQQTFMKLLSQSFFPTPSLTTGKDPLIFVPPHLRVIQISQVHPHSCFIPVQFYVCCDLSHLVHVLRQTPFILGPAETIFDNLVFGYKELPEEGSERMDALKERVVKILKRLNLGHKVVENLYTQGFVGANGDKLAKSIQAVIHIVRASEEMERSREES